MYGAHQSISMKLLPRILPALILLRIGTCYGPPFILQLRKGGILVGPLPEWFIGIFLLIGKQAPHPSVHFQPRILTHGHILAEIGVRLHFHFLMFNVAR